MVDSLVMYSDSDSDQEMRDEIPNVNDDDITNLVSNVDNSEPVFIPDSPILSGNDNCYDKMLNKMIKLKNDLDNFEDKNINGCNKYKRLKLNSMQFNHPKYADILLYKHNILNIDRNNKYIKYNNDYYLSDITYLKNNINSFLTKNNNYKTLLHEWSKSTQKREMEQQNHTKNKRINKHNDNNPDINANKINNEANKLKAKLEISLLERKLQNKINPQ